MKHGSLFSGIGGFDLAAQWMGWENVFHCEWAEFPRKLLKQNFPNSISYEDITKTDFTKHKGGIDIISGGFPCQPFSNTGQRKGTEDERYLWDAMLRAIREIQPRFIVAENVSGLVNWNGGMVFDKVQADLEAEGYEVLPFLLPACAVNANHRRDRIWFIAYSKSSPRIYENKNEGQNTQTIQEKRFNGNPKSEPSLLGGTDGIPDWMDRIKGLGNAIVPQVALEIFNCINLLKI